MLGFRTFLGPEVSTVSLCSCGIPIWARERSSAMFSGQPVQICFETGMLTRPAMSSFTLRTVCVAVVDPKIDTSFSRFFNNNFSYV